MQGCYLRKNSACGLPPPQPLTVGPITLAPVMIQPDTVESTVYEQEDKLND